MALAVRALGARRRRRAARPARRPADGRARHDARATPAAARSAPTSAPRTPARCCAPGSTRSGSDLTDAELLAWLQADDFSHADLLPPRPPRARAQARSARSTAGARRPPARATAGAAARSALFDACIAGHPLRAGGRLPRPREGQARRAATASRVRVALVADASAACTASRTRSTRSASAACPASRSRSSAPTRTSTAACSAVAEVDIPFYAGPEGRRAEPAGDRRGARRGPLRPRPPLLARARPASPPR